MIMGFRWEHMKFHTSVKAMWLCVLMKDQRKIFNCSPIIWCWRCFLYTYPLIRSRNPIRIAPIVWWTCIYIYETNAYPSEFFRTTRSLASRREFISTVAKHKNEYHIIYTYNTYMILQHYSFFAYSIYIYIIYIDSPFDQEWITALKTNSRTFSLLCLNSTCVRCDC